jgi:hypothetical protein
MDQGTALDAAGRTVTLEDQLAETRQQSSWPAPARPAYHAELALPASLARRGSP